MRKLLTTIGTLTASLLAIESLAAGALAVDERQGDQWGWAIDYQTQAEANAHALRQCGQGCSIVATFNNTCMAFAADQARGSTAYGHGRARTSSAAQANALRFCRQYGGTNSNCIVRAWGCDTADPVETRTIKDGENRLESPGASVESRAEEEVGMGSGTSPSSACALARNSIMAYSSSIYTVTNDSGCSCARDGVMAWTCQVRVRYEHRELGNRAVSVGTGTGLSRHGACDLATVNAHAPKRITPSLRSARDSGCYCPAEGYGTDSEKRWYCERVIRYYR